VILVPGQKEIVITLIGRDSKNKFLLAVAADKAIVVHRSEVWERIKAESANVLFS
jgi:sRNA-binding carbon storage regulator CsrA